jgi:predicted nuclease of predicted toxin-antitoxin system
VKFLFNQNLSHKLATLLQHEYPGSVAARDVGLSKAPDSKVWDFARSNGLVVVSKDSDFLYRSLLQAPPPKVIWIAIGNCSSRTILDLLHREAEQIRQFGADPVAALLILPRA